MAKWLAYFPWLVHPVFEPYWANFIFQKNKLTERSLKCACHSVDCMVTEWWLNATEIHLSRHHSVAIQPSFSHHSIDWKLRFHPVSIIHNNVFKTSAILKHLPYYRRYMADILPIRRKTLYNLSINLPY